MHLLDTKRTLLWVGCAALIIRAIYFLQHANSPLMAMPLLDQQYYDLCARQLAGHGGFHIDGFRPLLYPLFLSIFYTLNPDSGALLGILAQHALGIGLTIWIAYLTLTLFKSNYAGLIAGLLYALSAPPLFFEGVLMITTLFSFLLLGTWVLIFKATTAATIRSEIIYWLCSGIVLGLAAQARPNALGCLLFFPLLMCIRLLCKKKFNQSAPPLAALLGLLAVQLLFAGINSNYSNTFQLMTQAGGINFYLGNGEKADGMIPRQSGHIVYDAEHYRDPIQTMAEQEYRKETGTTGVLSQKVVSNFWKEKTVDEIEGNPGRWIQLMIKKSWLMLWNHEVPNNRSFEFAATQETPLLKWLPTHWWLLLLLAPWGVAALVKQKKTEYLIWMLTFMILFSGTIILFFVNSRFRIPLWPGLCVLGGGGAVYLSSVIREKKIPRVVAIYSIVLVLLSVINWFRIPPDPIAGDYALRAKAHHQRGNDEGALKDISAAIALVPNNPGYYFLQGNILLSQDNASEAIRSYMSALQLNNHDPMYHNNMGIALEETGDMKTARKAYLQALNLRPNHRAAKTNLLLLSIQTGDLDEAKKRYKQFSDKEQRNPTLQCAAAMIVFHETGDPNALQRAIKLNPVLAEQLNPGSRDI